MPTGMPTTPPWTPLPKHDYTRGHSITSPPYTMMATSAPVAFPTVAPTAAPVVTTVAPAIAEPGPTVVIPGNNGSVSCARYCNGPWGQGQLASRYPLYRGAYSAQAGASAGGTCPCIMTNRASWNQVVKPGLVAADLGIN
ncbi:MAG: hypothetical protein EOO40_09815 [Deltaproteobacteria bacterium]|nr:MAG: hypothetical protein EOO40_09815 [Deltaproteobacteria bacterium]